MDRFSQMHDEYLDYDRYMRHEEETQEANEMARKAKRNLRAILNSYIASNILQLERSLYKYTDCGAHLGVKVAGWGDEPDKMYWGGSLDKIPADELIIGLSVGSIVEGCDGDTGEHYVDLLSGGWRTRVKAFSAAVEDTEYEAAQIWDSTHGCEDCKMDGAINPDCKTCKGEGTIL